MLCKAKQRPDIAVYRGGEPRCPLFLVEVESGKDFKATVYKALFGIVDLLRYFRLYDTNCTICEGFAFPKWLSKIFVVKIKVEWNSLVFCYSFSLLSKDEVSRALVSTYDGVRLPIKGEPVVCYPVRLSDDDISLFHHNTRLGQISCASAILLKSRNKCFKFPILELENLRLRNVWATQKAFGTYERIISLDRQIIEGLEFFTYPTVRYDPMTRDQEYTLEVCQALYDKLDLAHCDVRLPNIAFNDNYHAVLIDLDRALSQGTVTKRIISSCMYRCGWLASEQDWMQLGWLIDWVLSPDCGDYHGRRELGSACSDDEFDRRLIEGMYNTDCLCVTSYCDSIMMM